MKLSIILLMIPIRKKEQRGGLGHAFPCDAKEEVSGVVTGVKPKVRYTRGKVAARRAVSAPIGRREIRANEQRPVERETPSRTVARTDAARPPNTIRSYCTTLRQIVVSLSKSVQYFFDTVRSHVLSFSVPVTGDTKPREWWLPTWLASQVTLVDFFPFDVSSREFEWQGASCRFLRTVSPCFYF